MKLFSGSSNSVFASKVATRLGKELSDTQCSRFNDGEVKIIISDNVRGENCFIIQSTCRSINAIKYGNSEHIPSVNDNIMEMLIMVDALKRGSAKTVNLVIPYFGYQRQDRKDYSRAPISAAVIARIIETLNVNRVMIFDLHAGQISGFFSNNCPVDNLYAEPYFRKYIEQHDLTSNVVFVAPDAGAVKTNYRVSQYFNTHTCSIFKNRKDNKIDHMMLIGDVSGKDVVMIDDMIDTAGTICAASSLLKSHGAKSIYVFATHGLFSGDAINKINKSDIDKVIVTNTVPHNTEHVSTDLTSDSKINIIDITWMCAEAIHGLNNDESISHLYNNYSYFLEHSVTNTM